MYPDKLFSKSKEQRIEQTEGEFRKESLQGEKRKTKEKNFKKTYVGGSTS